MPCFLSRCCRSSVLLPTLSPAARAAAAVGPGAIAAALRAPAVPPWPWGPALPAGASPAPSAPPCRRPPWPCLLQSYTFLSSWQTKAAIFAAICLPGTGRSALPSGPFCGAVRAVSPRGPWGGRPRLAARWRRGGNASGGSVEAAPTSHVRGDVWAGAARRPVPCGRGVTSPPPCAPARCRCARC